MIRPTDYSIREWKSFKLNQIDDLLNSSTAIENNERVLEQQ
jgi:hypothetical protein